MSLPPALDAALGALEDWPPVAALRASAIAYPLVNTLHIVGIALLFGAIVPLDLRLAGWRADALPVDRAARLLLPIAKAGLILAATAGLLLFATAARDYAASPLFRAKMVVLALAVTNALLLRRAAWRGTRTRRTRAAGVLSILLWLTVILLGRFVGYF